MRKFIYAKMALTNIKNNSKIYFPYILTCIGTVAVFYIMYALSEDPGLNEMSGGTAAWRTAFRGHGHSRIFRRYLSILYKQFPHQTPEKRIRYL